MLIAAVWLVFSQIYGQSWLFSRVFENYYFSMRSYGELQYAQNDTNRSYKARVMALKSVGRLVHWSSASTLSRKILGERKEEQNFKVLPGEQKSESTFSRIQFGINIRNFGSWILRVIFWDRNLGFDENFRKSYRTHHTMDDRWFFGTSFENKKCNKITFYH
jgi:hypothetical protein